MFRRSPRALGPCPDHAGQMKNEKSNMANGKSRVPVSGKLRVGRPRDFPYIIFHLRFFIEYAQHRRLSWEPEAAGRGPQPTLSQTERARVAGVLSSRKNAANRTISIDGSWD